MAETTFTIRINHSNGWTEEKDEFIGTSYQNIGYALWLIDNEEMLRELAKEDPGATIEVVRSE